MAAGRARICYPKRHTAGILKGGKLPHYNNPNYEVSPQWAPTDRNPVKRHNAHAQHIGMKGTSK
jgi:hypothetical protein